ncbi:unnamed protein product, partial [Rotaria magnacalcarata]
EQRISLAHDYHTAEVAEERSML